MGYTPGQVLGGRWKPLHYFLAGSLFTDVFGTCGDDTRCVFKWDNALAAFSGSVTLSVLNVGSGILTTMAAFPLELPRGAGSALWMCANGGAVNYTATTPCPTWKAMLPALGCAASGSDCLLRVYISSPSLATQYVNHVLLATPSAMTPLPPANVRAVVAPAPNADGSIDIAVSTDGTALYVTLVTAAQGRFSDNAVILPKGVATVIRFIPFGALDEGLLRSTLKAEHVAQYM